MADQHDRDSDQSGGEPSNSKSWFDPYAFDYVGGSDDIESYIADIVCEDGWEEPECFHDETTWFRFATEDIQLAGLIEILEDTEYSGGHPGLDFGQYGLRLLSSREQIRLYAQKTILEMCKDSM